MADITDSGGIARERWQGDGHYGTNVKCTAI